MWLGLLKNSGLPGTFSGLLRNPGLINIPAFPNNTISGLPARFIRLDVVESVDTGLV